MQTLMLQSWQTPPVDFTGIVEFTNGNKAWYKNGDLHREDGPAFEYLNGSKIWYKNGDVHREDGPAIEYPDGTKHWYKQGKWHRKDGPAIECPNGHKEWYLEGKKYSEEEWKFIQLLKKATMKTIKVGLFSEIPENFTGIVEHRLAMKIWYKNGLWHREDGPAVEHLDNGTKEWWLEGKLHREDGPALEHSNGYKEWYLEGESYSEEKWKIKVKKLKEPKMEVLNESRLQVLKLEKGQSIPKNFTGIADYPNGTKVWYKKGECHREDGPAAECPDGMKQWFKEGKFHREGGPAIEYPNGTKKWYKNGDLHREDGPACEYSDGEKRWYKEGVLHREDGPAVELENGSKFWHKDGKLHREDGPACEYSNGSKEWSLDNEKLSATMWKNRMAVLNESRLQVLKLEKGQSIPENFTGIVITLDGTKRWFKEGKNHRENGHAIELSDGSKFWFLNGKCHREGGPALEYSNGEKHWYKEGKFHREDGPAREYPNGYKEWRKNGKLHRTDGPAVEYSNGDQQWWIEGKLHREDGPAIEQTNGYKEWWLDDKELSEIMWKNRMAVLNESRLQVLKLKRGQEHPENFTGIIEYPDGEKRWFKEGKLHREDRPAVECSNGRKKWYKEGNLHREDGPAIEMSNGGKEWYFEGNRHREDGPACEYSNGDKYWYKDGNRHREDGPAIEYLDGSKIWYKNGKLHREGGPAGEYTDGTKEWRKNGKLHREDGPAREWAGGHKKWYLEGKKYSEEEWKLKVQELKEPKMEVLKLEDNKKILENYTGIVEFSNGEKHWYKDGKQHREDGPAVEHSNGYKEWYLEGKLHRTDGPAVEFPEGVGRWAINGVFLSEKEWKIKVGDLTQNSVPENSKFVETIKSDAKEVAVRIASQQIISTSKILITKLLKQKGKTESTITKFLNSNYGNAVTGAVAGVLLKGLASRFDGKYSRIINEISDELRVSSEVLIIDELATHVLDASEGLFNQLTTTKDLVRVAIEETKESFENPESITVDAAEKDQKSILSVA